MINVQIIHLLALMWVLPLIPLFASVTIDSTIDWAPASIGLTLIALAATWMLI